LPFEVLQNAVREKPAELGVIRKGRPQIICQNWPLSPLSAFVRIGPTSPPCGCPHLDSEYSTWPASSLWVV